MHMAKQRTMFNTLSARSLDEETALSASYGYLENDEDPLAPRSTLTPTEDQIPELEEPRQSSPTDSSGPRSRRPSIEIDLKYVDDCVDRFLKNLQEPKYKNPLTGDEISELFQSFYKQIEEELDAQSRGQLLSKQEQTLKRKTNTKILDSVERALCSTLYQKLFEPQGADTPRSQRFDNRMCAFRENQQLLDKLELDISPQLRASLEPVMGYLSNIEKAKPPQDKLYCIVQVNKMIADVFKDTNASGDAILPALVYCVLASPTSSIWRHSIYTRRYRRASALKGQNSYCLTNLEAAVHFLDTVTIPAEDLPTGVDAELFEPRSRANSVTSRSRSNSDARTTPIRARIGTIGASVGASVSKYLFAKIQAQQPATIADVRRNFDSDSTSVSTGDADSFFGPGQGPPSINNKFLHTDADSLSIGDVKQLLADYKRLANYVQYL